MPKGGSSDTLTIGGEVGVEAQSEKDEKAKGNMAVT